MGDTLVYMVLASFRNRDNDIAVPLWEVVGTHDEALPALQTMTRAMVRRQAGRIMLVSVATDNLIALVAFVNYDTAADHYVFLELPECLHSAHAEIVRYSNIHNQLKGR